MDRMDRMDRMGKYGPVDWVRVIYQTTQATCPHMLEPVPETKTVKTVAYLR